MIMRDCWCRLRSVLSLVMVLLGETAQCIFLLCRTLYDGGPNKCSQNHKIHSWRSHRMHTTAPGTWSSSFAQKFHPLHVGADVGQGKGVDRKRDILVFIGSILFLLLPVNEEEATDRGLGMFMYDQLRNLIRIFPFCSTLLLKSSSTFRETYFQVPCSPFPDRK